MTIKAMTLLHQVGKGVPTYQGKQGFLADIF
jgi:hypothetical protein